MDLQWYPPSNKQAATEKTQWLEVEMSFWDGLFSGAICFVMEGRTDYLEDHPT